MRLKSINLSGFKSFVDPTSIELPHDISVFVGPNGCGKSNVVDAVRLVVGESRASQIRGDSLSDIIFNGTESRSPTVQATVELLFDNTVQSITGPYASYSEISLRREIFRDLQSKFYLNGRACRRRDIQDLFLGSGFGARSYAVVEQGFIGRLVESSPDELRSHIEEVAGVSKYRDRRRETERRIAATNQNLERVRDHNAELNRQVARLERQVREANRYSILKDRERLAQAKLIAFQIRQVDSTINDQDARVRKSQLELQQHQTELQNIRTTLDGLRNEESEVNESFNAVQGEAFSARAKSGRIEEEVESRRIRINDTQTELTAQNERRRKLIDELKRDRQALLAIDQSKDELESNRNTARNLASSANESVENAQAAFDQWQVRWNELASEAGELEREKQYAQAVAASNSSMLDELFERRRVNMRALEQSEVDDDTQALETQLAELASERETEQRNLADTERELTDLRASNETDEASLRELEQDLLSVRDQLTANVAILDSVVSGKGTTGETELDFGLGMQDQQRLLEQIEVESGWEKAVETVLGPDIGAITVNALRDIHEKLDEQLMDRATVVEPISDGVSRDPRSLLSHVSKGSEVVAAVIGTVFACDNLEQALQLQLSLRAGERVVTRSGICIGKHWIRFPGSVEQEKSLIEIRESTEILRTQLASLQEQYDSLRQKIQDRIHRRSKLGDHAQVVRDRLQELAARHESLQLQLQRNQMLIAEDRDRRVRTNEELQKIDSRIRELQASSAEQSQRVSESADRLARFTELRQQLEAERVENAQRVESALSEARTHGDKYRELDVQFNTAISNRDSLQRTCTRLESDISELDRQIGRMGATIETLETELRSLGTQREEALRTYSEVDARLREIRTARDQLTFRIRENSGNAVLTEKMVEDKQSEVETERERQIQLNAEREHLIRDLVPTQHSFDEASQHLHDQEDGTTLQRALDRITNRINRLGAVNLAAESDLKDLTAERDLVVQQIEDLELSQETLQSAIRKIDQESLTLFQDTLERANEAFHKVFGKLFGGGNAALQLTDEDPLNSGIAMRVQPPGKRTKNVNALSGGEKSLAGIAFIFAMFELNPSPVCVLDEVDAALDDSNVERFIKLIKEMSDFVQFLIISHNRATMQVAESLIGVTMQEAGVSRLVSVDLEQALETATQ